MPTARVGQVYEHPVFGMGRVTSVEPHTNQWGVEISGQEVSIAFGGDAGTQTIPSQYLCNLKLIKKD